MRAALSLAADARRALASFLRGFVGMPADGLGSIAGNEGNTSPGSSHSPAAVREALAARAASRPSCC